MWGTILEAAVLLVFETRKKNISEGLQHVRLASHQGPVETEDTQSTCCQVLLCRHVKICSKLATKKTGSGHAQCVFF